MSSLDSRPAGLRICSLFTGIGGFEVGLARSGHHPILLCENDPFAQAVLASRFPQVSISPDIREIEKLPDCDLLTAGWPCQDLSLAGRTLGLAGPKSSLIEELFRIVSASTNRPKYILLENVAFALDLQGGNALSFVVGHLERLGYAWSYRILDTKLFGVPQRRRRLFVLAMLDGSPEKVLLDGIRSPEMPTEISPDFVGFYWTEGTRGTGWSPEAIPPLKGGSAIGIPSPPAIWDVRNGIFLKPGIEDAERLQGFPVNWTKAAENLPGGRARRWVLVGNAVSVPVAEWLGGRLMQADASDDVGEIQGPINGKWPRAAFGSPETGRFGVIALSEGPGNPTKTRLSDFGLVNATRLSERAITGFSRRFQASSLRKQPLFVSALNASIGM